MSHYTVRMYQRGYRDALKATAQRRTLNEASRFASSMAKYLSGMVAQCRLIEAAMQAAQAGKPLAGQPGNPRVLALRILAQSALRSQRYVDIMVNAASGAFPADEWTSASPRPPGTMELLDFYTAVEDINKYTSQILRPLNYTVVGQNGLAEQYEFLKKTAQQFKRAMDDMTTIAQVNRQGGL